jgi:hypothetical protein
MRKLHEIERDLAGHRLPSFPKKKIIWFGSALLLALLIFFVAPPLLEKNSKQAQLFKTLRSLSLVCRTYASDEGGRFPATLDDLVTEGLIDMPALLRTDLTLTGEEMPLLYRRPPNGSLERREPMIFSPAFHKSGKRFVAYANGSVEVMKLTDEEVERMLVATPPATP